MALRRSISSQRAKRSSLERIKQQQRQLYRQLSQLTAFVIVDSIGNPGIKIQSMPGGDELWA